MSSNPRRDSKNDKQEAFAELVKSMNDFFHEKPVRGFLQTVDQFFKYPFPHGSFPVEVHETDKEHVITAELPGVKKEQIHIDILGNQITIEVKNSEVFTEEDEKKHYYRKKQTFQRSSRTITLSHPINEKKVKASYQNGLLEIHIPKLRGKSVQIGTKE
ncbi:heat-shock protein Hsp20 [Bacillus sp. V3-13]|uniref:Hsp20/alpha crystallin family protein n=1 Tax=Bacillus sp. V3-13 TaxID=2053728 RepID=UPI000C769F5B|nr:Hsp20/alpha crystallin family protein [Bacillus sp. V3-13]PLR77180.1 heat-shock protein Hsp20 [Bacillus sp. V3-13]